MYTLLGLENLPELISENLPFALGNNVLKSLRSYYILIERATVWWPLLGPSVPTLNEHLNSGG